MDYKTDFLMGKYELGRFLGQGTFARVHYARSLKTGQSVAIKIIDKEKVSKVEFLKNQVKREISVMRKVRHPNIVNIYEVMATRTKIYFVIEYAKGGELFNKVAKGKLKEDVAQKYFQQLINAVDFCHSKGVYHRDIKPENLLLDGNDNLKVTDFGLSAVVESKRQDGLFHTACGTPAYVSPEVINQKGYDGVKSDIWSCGVVLFVLLAGYLPFHDKNLMDMYRKICKGEFKFPKGFSEDVRQLLSQILDPNPETRISIAKIRSSPWFKKDFNLKSPVTGSKGKSVALVNTDGNPGPSGSGDLNSAPREESIRPTKLDAFGIVFLLHRFDFTSSFEERDKRIEERFTSRQPASVIISWLIDTAKCRRYKIKLTDKGLLNFKVTKAGKKGSVSIDVEIFEIAPEFHLVEITKSSGDTAEYQQIMKEDIRPALQDIVCDWQGKQQHQINENNKHSCTNSTSATGGTTSN